METENLHLLSNFNKCLELMENSFESKFSSVIGNSEALIQFRLKFDLSLSKCNLFASFKDKLIFFQLRIFLQYHTNQTKLWLFFPLPEFQYYLTYE